MSKMITRGSVAGTELSGAQLKAALTGMVDALTTAGLHSGSRSTINADTALTVDQCGLLLVDCTSGNVALTLPASGDTTDDATFLICRIDNTVNTLSYVRGGSDTVEGSTSPGTIAGRGIIGLQMPADGTDWKVFSRTGGTPAGARAAIGLGAGADIASAATLPLNTRTGDIVRVNGTVQVNAVTLEDGAQVITIADGALPINVAGVLAYTCQPEDMVLWVKDKDSTLHAYVMRSKSESGKIQSVPTPTFNAGAMTIPGQLYTLDFQDIATGTITTVSAAVAAMVVPSGATIGLTNSQQSELALIALYPSADTIEYAMTNIAGGLDLSEYGLISTTALSTGADSANVAYSTTSRTNVPYRVLARYVSTQTTAGTWAQAMSAINGAGGNRVIGGAQFRRMVATATTSGSAVIYDNIPSWVKRITLIPNKVSTNGTSGWTLVYRVAGSNVTSGYTGINSTLTATGTVSSEFTSRAANSLSTSATAQSGRLVMENPVGNTWILTGQVSRITDTQQTFNTSEIDLAGPLSGLSFSTGDTFDAGNINLILEG